MVFYFSLIPITIGCVSVFDDWNFNKTVHRNKITIYSGDNHVWDTGNGVGAWSGTDHKIEEEPEHLIRAENDIGFIVFVVFVALVCILIYFVDKKRITNFN